MTEPTTSSDESPVDGYDRAAASRILAGLAFPNPFDAAALAAGIAAPRRHLRYRATPLTPEPGGHLTASQQRYLAGYMAPCRADQVTSATHRISWHDSDGVPNVAHAGPSDLGAVVPVVAREAMLVLGQALARNERLQAAASALDDTARGVLAATTTDGDPGEIFRIGVEAAARVLVQHAYLAASTPYRSAAELARGLRDSGVFGAVAGTWYWELQASTYRRGMIPVRFTTQPDGSVRYSPETVTVLRDMKAATIAQAHAVMARATSQEGLTVAQAVARYHHELDEIAKQYALLPAGEQPRCLATVPHDVDGERFSVLPVVVDAFVETFVALLDRVDVAPAAGPAADDPVVDLRDRTFHIPDMNCAHCRRTITGVLEGQGLVVSEVDLVSKRVVADFGTVGARERAFDAIRDAGYTVVPPGDE